MACVCEVEIGSHEFMPSDDDMKREIGWCDFCTFSRDHPNHARDRQEQ